MYAYLNELISLIIACIAGGFVGERVLERAAKPQQKNRLPGFAAFSTAALFITFCQPVDSPCRIVIWNASLRDS